MQKCKRLIAIGIFLLASAKGHSQTSEPLKFEKIIYHSNHCYGNCPAIDMQIDSNYNVLLIRDIWSAKGKTDSSLSGNFKGKLGQHDYFDLVATLIASDYANLKFPAEFCCDGILTSITVYANGKKTTLSSMWPPKEAQKLIGFLYDLALRLNLPQTSEALRIPQ